MYHCLATAVAGRGLAGVARIGLLVAVDVDAVVVYVAFVVVYVDLVVVVAVLLVVLAAAFVAAVVLPEAVLALGQCKE